MLPSKDSFWPSAMGDIWRLKDFPLPLMLLISKAKPQTEIQARQEGGRAGEWVLGSVPFLELPSVIKETLCGAP